MSKKSDQLGAGRFGGGGAISARRQAVAAATGVPTDGIAPPTELPPHRISPNPDNPRSSLGDLTDLAGSLKTHGQKQAITVMNRDAYVKANPEREADLEPDTSHVVIDGSSRLAAAREAGLTTIKIMVSDDQGSTADELLESALVANIHRQDLEELDEAHALKRLLTIHGNQRALAQRLHRSQGWVSQRLALLNLIPELQDRIGKDPINLLRAVGNKPAPQQAEALEQLKKERAQQEAHKRDRSERPLTAAAAPQKPSGDYAVITTPASGEQTTGSDNKEVPGGQGTAPAVPEPRTDFLQDKAGDSTGGQERPARRLPYDSPGELARILDRKIDSDETFFALLNFLVTRALERDPARLTEMTRALTDRAQEQPVQPS
ncbi:ParB/RepB/Spo0J family partition protein [Streptomyces griseoviridis]|uniref:ParB/RepB/Spo0J family partition protein n=1 Tax=Streptomyces griseoviridis TaxID=45398 RepID=UPI0033F5F826